MSLNILIMGVAIIVFWGVWGFLAKVAQARIGNQLLIWYLLAMAVILLLYLAVTGELWPLRLDGGGIALGAAVGVTAAAGTVLFYLILAQSPTSFVIPLTSLYPAVTAALGVWLLKEELTWNRVIGVTLAVATVFFLSR
jgi:transporter family protein